MAERDGRELPGLAELDDLVARGAISFDEYWDARIAIDAQEETAAEESRFDLPTSHTTGGSGGPVGSGGSVGPVGSGGSVGSGGEAFESLRVDEPVAQPIGPDWISPPPRPVTREEPVRTAPPMVAPPPPAPAAEGAAGGPDTPGPAFVRLDVVGPSADAAATRADDGRRARRWRPGHRKDDSRDSGD